MAQRDLQDCHWFVRAWPSWAWVGLILCMGLGGTFGAALVVGAVSLLDQLGLTQPLRNMFGDLAVVLSLGAIAFLGIFLGLFVFQGWAGRRYGGCLLTTTVLVADIGLEQPEVEPSLAEDGPGRRIPLTAVRGWTRTPHGLLLRTEDQGRLSRLFSPVLIPIHSDEDLALAERLLTMRSGDRNA